MLQLSFHDDKHPPVTLDQSRLTIGRDESNDLVLEEEGISGFHAEIQLDEENIFLVDMDSTNGTCVNGEKITGRTLIKAWDRLNFDKIAAEIINPEKRRPTVVRSALTNNALDRTWALKGQSGDVAGKNFIIGEQMLIGRDAHCDLILDNEMISSRHAQIQSHNGTAKLKDLGSTNGTFVNGEKITQSNLNDGDEIKIEPYLFSVKGPATTVNKTASRPALDVSAARAGSAAGPAQDTDPNPAAILEVVEGLNQGQSFDVRSHQATIGRSDDNDIVLPFETVSGCHAMLVFANGFWTIQDQGSVNGVFVNNKAVTSHTLESDDQIAIGAVVLQFKIPAFQSGDGRIRRTPLATKISGAATTNTFRILPWMYGLIGFGLAAIIIIAIMTVIHWNRTKAAAMPLQARKVWETNLSGRRQPTTPALADINGDKFLDVIVADAHGFILALDGQEGKKIFEVQMPDRVLAPPATGDLTGDGFSDVVVAGNAGRVIAVDGKGRVLWKTEEDLQLGAIINRPVLEDLNGDKIVDVVVPTAKMGLVAIDGHRGWLIWDTREMINGKCITAPVRADVNDDGTMDFVAATDKGQVLTITTRTSKPWKLWEAQVPSKGYASPLFMVVQKRGIVVIPTDHKGVFAFDAVSGNKVWHAQFDHKFFASPLASDVNGDDVPDVILGADDGKLIILNGLTGDTIWRLALNNGLQATPGLFDVDDDGLPDLIVADGGGGLQVLNVTDGHHELNLVITGANAFAASPVLGDVNNDRMLEVVTASDNGIVIAYGLNRFVTKGRAVWPLFLGNDQHWFQ
ncbi:MAG: FHA domain-containing protein [Desulfobacteraceae bacterium]|jgi:pSer/pThr/pTyr-binding forkhead associated (FHA) protein